ncbi:LPS export ABC transporter periplasmic protein LptC [Caenispirillum bisanense]|uniref:Lipopolysaccharide export system protein LptC n=1 Tax=Caenispirillum bisanense TaxID=414052 RepID=A0A286GAN7_9PROT|nr:LPS export ABC transporter periplasmic protein LptC [Caenispirillum bisanense]SOD92561.1 lipopolysaccharide export system protein LptC [Caenispirillum bisanense]
MMAAADHGGPVRPGPLRAADGAPRPRRGQRHGSGYSRFVRLMKVGLMGIAVLLVVLVAIWPQLQTVEEEFRVKFASLKGASVDQIEMINARYFGTDEKNRPYAVTAARAVELPEDRVQLDNPKADMTLEDGWVMLNGDTGIYDKTGKTLLLTGNVNVFQDEGNEFHTSTATIDVEAGDATGDEPVQGAGSFGWFTGEGFELTDKGKRFKVTGKSKLVLTGVEAQEGR